MDNEEILDKIRSLESRVKKIESMVYPTEGKIKNDFGTKKYEGITGGIRFLIDHGFFNTLKSSKEVHDELKKEGYYYRSQAVDTILRRDLVTRKKILVSKKTLKNQK
ncbi:MAG: hypothetical protein HYZ56_00175 [Nitrosopumilales archaeon]|nr:hypothetical protein [Nitrosopumilales archaeon]